MRQIDCGSKKGFSELEESGRRVKTMILEECEKKKAVFFHFDEVKTLYPPP